MSTTTETSKISEADSGKKPEPASVPDSTKAADNGAQEQAVKEPNPLMKWYIIHTYSGYEAKVKTSIEERLGRAQMVDKVAQIVLPMEDVVEIRKGKKKITSRKFFPGYLLVEMEMNEDLWYLVKDTQRVTGFLGGNKPVPLADEEVTRLLEQMNGSADKPKHKVAFDEGENVRVIDGPFANFSGVVDAVNMDKGKVKVMVSIFGRATPVELEFPQVEKV